VVIQSIATQNAALFPNLDTQTEVGFTQLQGWGVRKNAVELLDSLDRWMGER
jgi:hypothetical protein